MSMLADPRRKQKISADPRNLHWKNDQNKFGQKLMEKMGWTSGKGLGLKEEGKVDPIKVSLKADNRGVGCTRNYADDWIAHQDDFNSLLASLNSENAETGSASDAEAGQVQSLEKKSKNSKGRLHYMKFAKGKDLSCKSSEDLDCVFGRRKSKSAPSTTNNASEANSEEETEVVTGKSDVNTFTSGTSVQDYFAQKMAHLKKQRIRSPPEKEENDTDDWGETRCGFGFSATTVSQSPLTAGFVPAGANLDESPGLDTSDAVQETLGSAEYSNSSNEIKKKKRKTMDKQEALVDETPQKKDGQESGEKSTKKKEDKHAVEVEPEKTVESVEGSRGKKRKSKQKDGLDSRDGLPAKKAKHAEEAKETLETINNQMSEDESPINYVEKKKKKKKKKSKKGDRESDEAASEPCETGKMIEDNLKKKEKKGKQDSESEIPGASSEELVQPMKTVESVEESRGKKKKKRKRKDEVDSSEDLPAKNGKKREAEETSETINVQMLEEKSHSSNVEKKKKKKKSKKGDRESDEASSEPCETREMIEDNLKKTDQKGKQERECQMPGASSKELAQNREMKRMLRLAKREVVLEKMRHATEFLDSVHPENQSLPTTQLVDEKNTVEWGTNDLSRHLRSGQNYGFKGANISDIKGYGHQFGIEKTVVPAKQKAKHFPSLDLHTL